MRCFLAVEIPDDVRAALARLQQELRVAARLRVTWGQPDTFHVTLKFLGETSAEQQQALAPCLTEALAGWPAPDLVLAGAGAFPEGRRPRVLWAGMAQGAQALTALAGAVDRACARAGFPPEERPFHAHVTLGRVRVAKPAPELVAALGERRALPLGAWRPDAVTLFESRLGAAGARHRPIRRWSLGTPASSS